MPYEVTSRVDGRVVGWSRLDDPFIRHTVHIGWPDLLRAIFRRRLVVKVAIDADHDTIRRVMDTGRPRRCTPPRG
jgi:hypothetical protein